jgi:hypothetical protein
VARYNEIVRFWRGRTVFVRLNLDAQGCMLTQQLDRLRGALEAVLERAAAGRVESLLQVLYLFRARGRQTRYDEGSVPGWLEAWGACQEAWRSPAGAVEGAAEGANA